MQAVTEYLAAVRRLGPRSLSDAVDGFLQTAAVVQRVDLAVAIEEFISGRQAKTRAAGERRAQLSQDYAYITSLYLRHFAACFKGFAVCDLDKGHFDLFMNDASRAEMSPKSRNHYRTTLRMFLNWAVKKDYLAQNHRLLEAPGLEREVATGGEIAFYRPEELRGLLHAADDFLRPGIALCALAGLRQIEVIRLSWEDVFRVPEHVEVSVAKSKTRSRRLVEIVPALALWLEPHRHRTGPIWPLGIDRFQERLAELREQLRIPSRANGLRHAFCTFHYALHANENLTAQQAGNPPPR